MRRLQEWFSNRDRAEAHDCGIRSAKVLYPPVETAPQGWPL
jgi:hypothetical protein